jgi:transcriptional regulator with XRE-family HTH domain
MREIGELIKRQRKTLGISQEWLAKELGVSRQMVGLYEKGAQPSRAAAFKLAELLQLDVGVFDPLLAPVARVDTSSEVHSIPVYRLESFLSERRGNENMLGTSEGELGEVLSVAPARRKCIAVRMTDDSMSPIYGVGDTLIIDPTAEPRDKCRVLVSFGDETAIVRQYNFRGVDRKGSLVFDLSTPNPDHITVTVNAENPGKIEGVVVERRVEEYSY